MKLRNRVWPSALLLATVACVRTSTGPVLRSDSTRSVEVDIEAAAVRMRVPRHWTALAPSPSRAEFVGPDRRSRVYLRAMPAVPKSRSCRRLVLEYSKEVIDSWGGPPRTQLAEKSVGEDRVDFELRRTDPKPTGEIILSRVQCEDGALAIASCAGPTSREAELRPVCASILESVEIAARPVPTATTR